MNVTIYALKSCDSCKKAIKALTAAGHQLEIIDVCADGVPEARLVEWLATHGAEIVINRKSTTWRASTRRHVVPTHWPCCRRIRPC